MGAVMVREGLATKKQLGAIHALLAKMGLVGQKGTLVGSYTNNRETSSAKMRVSEARELIGYLNSIAPKEVSAADKMKRKIIAQAHEMGWNLTPALSTSGEGVNHSRKAKIDMNRVNAWCVKSGKFKKALDTHTESELVVLVSQFERVYKSYLNGI